MRSIGWNGTLKQIKSTNLKCSIIAFQKTMASHSTNILILTAILGSKSEYFLWRVAIRGRSLRVRHASDGWGSKNKKMRGEIFCVGGPPDWTINGAFGPRLKYPLSVSLALAHPAISLSLSFDEYGLRSSRCATKSQPLESEAADCNFGFCFFFIGFSSVHLKPSHSKFGLAM